MDILNTVGEFSKVGIIGLSFFAILVVVWLMNRIYTKQIEANKQNTDNQIKAYNDNSEKDREIIRSLTYEISQASLATTELTARNDVQSDLILRELKEMKKDNSIVHERINAISEKQTMIDMRTERIEKNTEKCQNK